MPYFVRLICSPLFAAPARAGRPIQSRRWVWGVVLLATSWLLFSCASTPDVGIRSDFEEHRITTIAIAPFYTTGSFGLDAEQRDEIAAAYEAIAAEALRQQGFEVMDSQALRHHLLETDQWSEFTDGIHLRQAITAYFEPSASPGHSSIEVLTLVDLARSDAFPVETILFGEIVYHSEGTCREIADDHIPYARLSIHPAAPDRLPRPCVSSHFQAKLVDVHTGQTMWFNRMFVETHTHQLDSEIIRETIAQTVQSTVAAEAGIAPLAPIRAEDRTHAESR